MGRLPATSGGLALVMAIGSAPSAPRVYAFSPLLLEGEGPGIRGPRP